MELKNNLTGKTFGRLFVIERGENSKWKLPQWKCKCECGSEKLIASSALVSGRTISCGCFAKENISRIKKTHGVSKTRLWNIWTAMRARCKSDVPRVAKYYKNRGIAVCKEWESFENFQRDMQESYSEHVKLHGEKRTSIDRIDSDLGYYKENCRWATPDIQSKNQRSHYIVSSFENIQKLLKEISEINGVKVTLTEKQFNKICDKLR